MYDQSGAVVAVAAARLTNRKVVTNAIIAYRPEYKQRCVNRLSFEEIVMYKKDAFFENLALA